MARIRVEQGYDPEADQWTATGPDGQTFQGRSPRKLRGAVSKAYPGVDVETSYRLDSKLRSTIDSLVKSGTEFEARRTKMYQDLDRLDLKRWEVAEQLSKVGYTMEMIAELLHMKINRVQQLCDPAHAAGKKVRDLKAKRIAPGDWWLKGKDD